MPILYAINSTVLILCMILAVYCAYRSTSAKKGQDEDAELFGAAARIYTALSCAGLVALAIHAHEDVMTHGFVKLFQILEGMK